MRSLLAVLLVAGAALAEDAPPKKSDTVAEGLPKKIEEKIAKAKTVTIRASSATQMGKIPITADVILDFKEGNKARMFLSIGGKSVGAACDGKILRGKSARKMTTKDAEADFAANVRAVALRESTVNVMSLFEGNAAKPAPEYGEFAFGADEKIGERAVRVVTFVAKRDGGRQAITIWIDEKALEVVKREAVEQRGGVEVKETIMYTKMAVDEEIADEAFAKAEPGPEPKKEEK